jgi:hypothetical protein
MDAGSKEQNFWPGFVDALSNVVLVMIFVVVVFVVTLFYYSQKLAEIRVNKMVTKGEVQVQSGSTKVKPDAIDAPQGADADAARLKSESRDKSNEIDKLKREIADLKTRQAAPPLQASAGSLRSDAAPAGGNNNIQVRVEKAKEIAPGAKVDGDSKAVVLHFDKDATELSPEAGKTLDGSIGDWVRRVKSQQGKIVITGVIGSAEFSEARRRAYYRTVAVRNHLIDAGVDKERVVSRVSTSENSAESNARVIIQYQAAQK